MSYTSLQLNLLSSTLRAKLPPTDCRLRPDMRLYETGDVDAAQAEKDRLE